MPEQHALLSPSAAHRWMHCTAAPRLEAKVPDRETDFALEGTLAHAYCALKLKTFLGKDTAAEVQEINELNGQYHTGEMDEYTDTYKTIVLEKYGDARTVTADALLLVETRLDFADYVPDAFGTSDAVIIADGLMEVIDFKYGKGVRVSAVENEQMKIYALGAYLRFSLDYDIERIRMTIVQPRLDNLSEYEVSVADLLSWARDTLRPKAVEAYRGDGAQNPGDWCRFCKVRGNCRTLADRCTGVAGEYKDLGLIYPEEMAARVLPLVPMVKAWVATVEEYALQKALEGVSFPGYKLVEGRSVRKITDEDAVRDTLARQGYHETEYMKPAALCGLTDLEKLVGKKRFAAMCGDYIIKPQGKPTLVTEDDKRPAINPADDLKDFN